MSRYMDIDININSFKKFLERGYYSNDDIAYFSLERLENQLDSTLKAIYPINLGTPNFKKFVGYTDNHLVVAYSKEIDVEKIDRYTKEKYTAKDREIIIDKIPKNQIKRVKLIEHSTEEEIHGGSLELYIELDIECDGDRTIYLNSRREKKVIKDKYDLNEYKLIDTIELFAKELI